METSSAVEGLGRLLDRYGVGPSAAETLRSYLRLLEKWNFRVNLTASTRWESLAPLFEEAIWAARFHSGGTHLDIGTGAGFPAIPIRVLHPGMQLDLVESRSRRCVFLETAARELGLANVRIHEKRLDLFLEGLAGAGLWDCISWKALRVSAQDAAALLVRAPKARFWLFHGRELPLENPGAWERATRLCSRETFGGGRRWFLSVYVSRDTETPFHVKQAPKPESPESHF
jgi:16S rRNA (guanine(527)-N(7))-methyltransferase RsmG